MGKKKSLIILIFVSAIFLISAIFCACSKKEETSSEGQKKEETLPTNTEVIVAPTASNLVVGQTTDESALSGEFSVEGQLCYTDEAQITTSAGVINRGWKFTPADGEKYTALEGSVTIQVYNYKISYEENGGFEIADVYFNESYTLNNKPITAKNEYRFDGWAQAKGSVEYIEYPHEFTGSTTLYAGYTFHTAEKLKYSFFYYADDPNMAGQVDNIYINNVYALKRCQVSQNDENIDPEIRDTIPTFNHPLTEPKEGSIEGEVIIADMYNDYFVTEIGNFYGSGITGFEFNNFVTMIVGDCFAYCVNLDLSDFEIPRTVTYIRGDVFAGSHSLKNLFIPNSVTEMWEAFEYCYGLETVEFEEGEREVEIGGAFMCCYSLRSAIINRATSCNMAFYSCYNLENVVFDSNIQDLSSAFVNCHSLVDVEMKGENLQRVGDFAFANCSSLTELKLPPSARISPLAFYGSLNLTNITLTDEQINGIAQELHDSYIGGSSKFTVNIERDEKYAGQNCQGSYVYGEEEINLKIGTSFSINALDVLIHEFFHHYQTVLLYGVGDENFQTVNTCSFDYYINSMPGAMKLYIVANDRVADNDGEEYVVYERYVYYCEQFEYPYILVKKDEISKLWGEYIELLPDESNYNEYWNQPYEVAARDFASIFTGINYDEY